jgi:hypothetical protein
MRDGAGTVDLKHSMPGGSTLKRRFAILTLYISNPRYKTVPAVSRVCSWSSWRPLQRDGALGLRLMRSERNAIEMVGQRNRAADGGSRVRRQRRVEAPLRMRSVSVLACPEIETLNGDERLRLIHGNKEANTYAKIRDVCCRHRMKQTGGVVSTLQPATLREKGVVEHATEAWHQETCDVSHGGCVLHRCRLLQMVCSDPMHGDASARRDRAWRRQMVHISQLRAGQLCARQPGGERGRGVDGGRLSGPDAARVRRIWPNETGPENASCIVHSALP